jgi:predicted MFS family arabinose efflux permease
LSPQSEAPVTPAVIALLACSCGVAVSTLYLNQPLLALIGSGFGTTAAHAAPVSMATQLGYAAGLLLLGPLGDRVPRKPLIVALACGLALALIGVAAAPSLSWLIAVSLLVGVAATFVQQIVPLAAQLAPDHARGRVVGTVMSGLLFGILGGRVVAGFVGEAFGWRPLFAGSAVLVALLAAVLAWRLPNPRPTTRAPYGPLLISVFTLAARHRTLRAAAINGGFLFGAFTIFWVALTPLLASSAFRLGPQAAGLFGVIGVVGALVAPLAGRMSDLYGPGRVLSAGVATVLAAYVVFAASGHSLIGLAVGTVLLDSGIQAALIANQARIFALDAAARSRINAFFMTIYFLGGASGSLAAGFGWGHLGWTGAVIAGLAFTVAAAVAHVALTPKRRRAHTCAA